MSEPKKCNKCQNTGRYLIPDSKELLYLGEQEIICDCKSLLNKYNRLLEFVSKVSNMPNVYFQDDATEILKEIGEL